jgi:hypothetical protein
MPDILLGAVRSMKGRITRIWCATIVALLAGVVIYGIALAFPEPLFAYTRKDHNFIFYSNSPIDPRTSQLTEEVNAKLARSEISDKSVLFRVFIVGNERLYAFFNGPYRHAIARNYEIGNPILVPTLDMERGRIVHFDGRSARAANIIAHEAVHTLMQRRLGLYRTLRLPWWKREGYAEYIASDLAHSSEAPLPYQQAMRKVVCLIEKQRLDFWGMIDYNQTEADATTCQ